jgi:hypothetical protein
LKEGWSIGSHDELSREPLEAIPASVYSGNGMPGSSAEFADLLHGRLSHFRRGNESPKKQFRGGD